MRLIRHCAKAFAMKAWWLAGVLIVAHALPAEAALCTLTWLPNTEPDLAGYRIYHSFSSNGFTAGGYNYQTTNTGITCEEMGVEMDGKLHYWTVTAYDVNGNESSFPSQVWIQMPLLGSPATSPPPPPAPPSPTCLRLFFRICM